MKRAIFIVLAVAVVLLFRGRLAKTSAADSEDVTWGATDPTWSPDSRALAFSLFGSIWRVPESGGDAEQLTASPGYHAHPAWSPTGGQIAYVRGVNPTGRLPNISGALMLLDTATGREQEIHTPGPVSSTLAWSPDGTRLVCGLRLPNGEVLLHEITPATSQVRQMNYLGIRAHPGSPWIDVAWNPKRDEVFFTGERATPPEVWTLNPNNPRVMVQLPLTRYRREDIAQLNSLSALPDGSGVVYSANLVNGQGNYELYRVPRQGGAPVNLTNSARDEFSPAVSPDGKWIAHVSNHLGNVDLFVMPVAGGDKRHVRVSKLKFRKPQGELRIRVLDEEGNPTAARLYVRASDGKAYCPSGSPIFYFPFEAGSRDGFFLATGDNTLPIPAGRTQLVALKGVEYDIADRTIEVAAHEITEVTLQMRRWTNWLVRGWYTGENHFHANYNGLYYQRPKQSLTWLQAEDLNAANMMVANSEGAAIHDKEFFTGGVNPLSTARYVLYWGQEYRNSFPLGHMAFLNLKEQVPPSYTSVIGSDSPYDFPLNTTAAQEAHRQGGLVSYVHPTGVGRDVFDTAVGAKELPVGAALGTVDAIDVLPTGEPAYELWYSMLNCGFKFSAGAGTDVFTNWRGINGYPGSARQYVEVGSNMNWQNWLARFREGRNFVTNGPLLTFTVSGKPMGAEIRIPAGQTYHATLAAEFTSRVPLSKVEVIQNGRVIETKQLTPNTLTARIEKEVLVDRSSWFAVRAAGPPARGITVGNPTAHSGAIWVIVGGAPVIVKEDVELMLRWIDRLWLLLEERNNFGPGQNRDRARMVFEQARAYYRARLSE